MTVRFNEKALNRFQTFFNDYLTGLDFEKTVQFLENELTKLDELKEHYFVVLFNHSPYGQIDFDLYRNDFNTSSGQELHQVEKIPEIYLV